MTARERLARATRRGAILSALIALGCDSSPVVGPVPQGPTVPPAAALEDGTIAGTVFEHGTRGSHAAPGLRIRLRDLRSKQTMDTISDSTGHYEFSGVPAHAAVVIAPPVDSDHRAPCPSGTDAYSGAGMRLDVHVVPTSVLTSTGVPASLPTYAFIVHGTVLGPSGVVSGASVELAYYGDPLSATLTGPDGKFLLCVPPPGVGTDQDIEIRVRKNGFRPLTSVENLNGGGTVIVWISLVPE